MERAGMGQCGMGGDWIGLNGVGWDLRGGRGMDGVRWSGMGMDWDGMGLGMGCGGAGEGMGVADPMSLRIGIVAQCEVCSLFADVRIFSTRPGAFREGLKVF